MSYIELNKMIFESFPQGGEIAEKCFRRSEAIYYSAVRSNKEQERYLRGGWPPLGTREREEADAERRERHLCDSRRRDLLRLWILERCKESQAARAAAGMD